MASIEILVSAHIRLHSSIESSPAVPSSNTHLSTYQEENSPRYLTTSSQEGRMSLALPSLDKSKGRASFRPNTVQNEISPGAQPQAHPTRCKCSPEFFLKCLDNNSGNKGPVSYSGVKGFKRSNPGDRKDTGVSRGYGSLSNLERGTYTHNISFFFFLFNSSHNIRSTHTTSNIEIQSHQRSFGLFLPR